MRLGRVKIAHSYVVDLDNEEMCKEAATCLYEDLLNAVKFDELDLWIETVEDSTAVESDIASFLTEESEKDWLQIQGETE